MSNSNIFFGRWNEDEEFKELKEISIVCWQKGSSIELPKAQHPRKMQEQEHQPLREGPRGEVESGRLFGDSFGEHQDPCCLDFCFRSAVSLRDRQTKSQGKERLLVTRVPEYNNNGARSSEREGFSVRGVVREDIQRVKIE